MFIDSERNKFDTIFDYFLGKRIKIRNSVRVTRARELQQQELPAHIIRDKTSEGENR